jgi:hypothetical protein
MKELRLVPREGFEPITVLSLNQTPPTNWANGALVHREGFEPPWLTWSFRFTDGPFQPGSRIDANFGGEQPIRTAILAERQFSGLCEDPDLRALHGGRCEIRTRDTRRCSALAVRCLQPLGQSTGLWCLILYTPVNSLPPCE